VKPAPFDYVRPETLEEALAELERGGEDAKPLAGGQSLVPLLNMRLARPSLLVDLNRVAGLDRIRRENGSWHVGATTRQRAMPEAPLVGEALPHVGHVVTRNRGTVGGSIAHADPGAELAVCLVALGGSVVVESRTGRREISATDFFRGPFSTAIAPGELVVETIWPAATSVHGYAFEELALRHGDFAQAMCACVAGPHGIRVALGSVVDRPLALDCPLDPRAAAEQAAAAADPVETIHATAEYRRHATRVLVERAARRALEAAT
jgi:2-furoyl-CoA dehydrogenase FAD binding subunit